jgi:hypothetical protein
MENLEFVTSVYCVPLKFVVGEKINQLTSGTTVALPVVSLKWYVTSSRSE